jgi:hypothetical protein
MLTKMSLRLLRFVSCMQIYQIFVLMINNVRSLKFDVILVCIRKYVLSFVFQAGNAYLKRTTSSYLDKANKLEVAYQKCINGDQEEEEYYCED